MPDWTAIISGAVSGSIFGSAASLVSPWVNWGVEKRRLRRESRVKLISTWRLSVMNAESTDDFRDSAGYASMRPYLLRSIIEHVEGDTITIKNGGRGAGVDNFKPTLYDEITRIEKYWKLV
jgi:hypothetical protein